MGDIFRKLIPDIRENLDNEASVHYNITTSYNTSSETEPQAITNCLCIKKGLPLAQLSYAFKCRNSQNFSS